MGHQDEQQLRRQMRCHFGIGLARLIGYQAAQLLLACKLQRDRGSARAGEPIYL